jgi:hypothetical protein
MPEALIIILVIGVGAIWLLVKISQGIVAFLDEALKGYNKAASKRTQNRYSRGRNRLRQYIYVLMPDELDPFERHIEYVRMGFQQAQRLTKFVPCPPAWQKEDFQSCTLPHKRSGYGEMNIDDIGAIMTSGSEFSTWSYQERQIIGRVCDYPTAPPSSNTEQFAPFPTLNANLKYAVFKVDSSQVGKRDVGKYFADEQNKTLAYNNRRANLIIKASDLNSTIEEWNRTSRISWDRYVIEAKQMESTAVLDYHAAAQRYSQACREESSYFKRLREGYKRAEKPFVIERLGFVLDRIKLPGSVPHTWDIDFDEEQKIAVIDVGLPDVVHRPPYKTVILKSGVVKKSLNQTERKELIPQVHPAVLLRMAHEVFRNDPDDIIKLLVLNGWVKFDDPATGKETKAYTASLMVEKGRITGLNLAKIDPMVAFNNLHGKSAGRLIEIIPIEPVLSLNRNDSRFVNAKEILEALGTETNLAAMDWQDFEHLIRELFAKEFVGRGVEVKVTQTSRDRGVDAIVFDPDPIRGGKYVIQAKRYTHTVDVSAVRDLCAVVQKEGASRGILVTTSTYGADAYAFANNEPVTLLNGAELLGLLKKHGYSFRIDLQEARRLA